MRFEGEWGGICGKVWREEKDGRNVTIIISRAKNFKKHKKSA